jgi:hypothetical protein
MKPWLACLTLITACSHPPAAPPMQPTPEAAPTLPTPEAAPAQPAPEAAPAQPAPAQPAPAQPAPAPPAPSAVPQGTLAAIDVFGAKHVSNEELIATAGFVVGSPVTFASQEFGEQIEGASQRLKERYRFAFVDVSPISYFGTSPDAGKVFITIDVVEPEDARRLKFAPEPSKDIPDPDGLIAAWLDYEAAVWPLQRSGALKPPYTCKGGMHCALGFNHPDLEHREDLFIEKVPGRVTQLTAVLRRDRNHKRRAAAAFLLAYARNRKQVVNALLPSIDDPKSSVRNNVMRVLVMIQQNADTVVVPLKPVLHAMHFPTTTDRNKAAYLLAGIAKHAPAADRARIARELGDMLLVMAAMKQPNNRDPAIDILKAISGEDHGADVAAWRAWLDQRRARK